MFIIKFCFYFTLSFIILSFPIQNRTVFHHLNKYTATYTTQLFSKATNEIKKNVKKGIKLSEKAFSNTKPPASADKIHSKLSSTKKATINPREIYEEDYTVEEQEMLRKIFAD